MMCEVRGRLLQDRSKDTLVAVGDRVWVQTTQPGKGLIERIEPRHSVLSRQQPGVNIPAEDVILANPDQALVVPTDVRLADADRARAALVEGVRRHRRDGTGRARQRQATAAARQLRPPPPPAGSVRQLRPHG